MLSRALEGMVCQRQQPVFEDLGEQILALRLLMERMSGDLLIREK